MTWHRQPADARGYEYRKQHKNLHAARGRAADFAPCVGCGDKAHEWSWRHGCDPWDVFSYDPRCFKCHRIYDDWTSKAHTPELHAKRQTPENIAKRVAASQTPEAKAKRFSPENNAKRAKATQGHKRKDGKVPVPNIYVHSQNKVYHVQVRKINGGCFRNLADAVKARNILAVQVYGPDAKQYTIDGELLRQSD